MKHQQSELSFLCIAKGWCSSLKLFSETNNETVLVLSLYLQKWSVLFILTLKKVLPSRQLKMDSVLITLPIINKLSVIFGVKTFFTVLCVPINFGILKISKPKLNRTWMSINTYFSGKFYFASSFLQIS